MDRKCELSAYIHTFHLSWDLDTPGQVSKRQKKLVSDNRFPFLLELLRVDSEASLGNPRGMKVYGLYKEIRKRVMAESLSMPDI